MWNLIASGITGIINTWFTTKQKKQQAETDKYIAELNATTEYDTQAQRNMQHTWKDEYLILLHTFPIWGYIITSDDLASRLDILWLKFESAPQWWWWIYMGMVVSTFGLRWMVKGFGVPKLGK